MIVGVPWNCMKALDDQRLLSTTRQIERDLIAFPLERPTSYSLLELVTPASAQLGSEPLGHREEDMLSKLDDLFRASVFLERLVGSTAIGVDLESVQQVGFVLNDLAENEMI